MENDSKNNKNSTEFSNDGLGHGKVKSLSIASEMKKSFLEYAMSVIVSRALPNARDGLKPVQRRIIYSLNEQEMVFSKPRKKSAKVVGDVLAKYHPHGDSSVYEAMVRMAQDFSLRYPLIDGQGNFGSIDGDSAAAMRYTEARLAKISNELLYDIKKNTVDFQENYDNSEKEPQVLPTRLPHLLMNGSIGIAVGMATSIPPHNLKELITASKFLFTNELETKRLKPEAILDELIKIVKGPDFPTGALVLGTSGIEKAYRTGNGILTQRSEVEVINEEGKNPTIVISSIPFNVKKSSLIEGIADLVKQDKIKSIKEIRDETNHKGIRIVIILKKGYIPEIELNYLYKHSMLQSNFSMNMIAIHENEPISFNLYDILNIYKNHLVEIYRRSIKYSLMKWEARLHIVEGLIKITEGKNIDIAIQIIRESMTPVDAYNKLKSKFGLSQKQAEAVGDMRIIRLNSLDQIKIRDERDDLNKKINHSKSLLNNKSLLYKEILKDLDTIVELYGDERKTKIIPGVFGNIKDEDLIPKKDVVIYLSNDGYIKRIPQEEYRVQNRGGVGKSGLKSKESDYLKIILTTHTHIDLLIFTNKGLVYRMRATEVPEMSRQSKGLPIVNIIPALSKDEKVNVILPVENYDKDKSLVFITKKGLVKRTKISEFSRINLTGKISIKLRDNDELSNVLAVKPGNDLFIAASNAKIIRFDLKELRTSGRAASGSTGLKLTPGEYVASSTVDWEKKYILSFSDKGRGKLSNIEDYKTTKRAGKGYLTLSLPKDGKEKMIGLSATERDDDLIVVTDKGTTIRLNLGAVSIFSKNTKGVKLIKVRDGEKVISYSIVKKGLEG